MTKKDYELSANEINQEAQRDVSNARNIMTLCVTVFQQDNPLFNPAKFETACLEGKHIRKSIKTEACSCSHT